MTKRSASGKLYSIEEFEKAGLDPNFLTRAINETYELLDRIDQTLVESEVEPLSQIVELANLSSMIGNIFSASLAHNSNGLLIRNGPHKYPDLLSTGQSNVTPNIEVKMALENNKPKGHLVKTGHYITCRYVLCDSFGKPQFEKSARGQTPYIWEVRFGELFEEHFSVSNTEGDSGKTAVVNKLGMDALRVVYLDAERMPFSDKSRVRKEFIDRFS